MADLQLVAFQREIAKDMCVWALLMRQILGILSEGVDVGMIHASKLEVFDRDGRRIQLFSCGTIYYRVDGRPENSVEAPDLSRRESVKALIVKANEWAIRENLGL